MCGGLEIIPNSLRERPLLSVVLVLLLMVGFRFSEDTYHHSVKDTEMIHRAKGNGSNSLTTINRSKMISTFFSITIPLSYFRIIFKSKVVFRSRWGPLSVLHLILTYYMSSWNWPCLCFISFKDNLFDLDRMSMWCLYVPQHIMTMKL